MIQKPDIILINPRINNESQNKKINNIVNITFPTSLGVLYSYLKKFNLKAEIIDEQIDPIDDQQLKKIIKKLKAPKIIGISVLTLNSGRAYELSKKIKSIDPKTITILGGIHPTVIPEEAIAEKSVDFLIRGEGEETLKELITSIKNKKSYKNILGITYRDKGKVINNPPRPMIENLDEIPPFPYEIFAKNLDKYPNFAGVFGSRGCPYGCTFCSSRSISGRKFRYHSVDRVIHEIKTLVDKYKQDSIHLMDDNIAVNKQHFKELCDAIIKEGLHKKASFNGSLRGDNATDEILDMAIKANFKILYYGLETGNERLMKVINKGETLATIVDAIKRSAQKGFSVGTTIIFGLPTEKRRERYQAINLVKKLPLSSVRFNTLTPYPGTPVYIEENPKGKVRKKGNWENFGVQYMWESDDIPYVPETSHRIELIFDTMWANLSYYISLSGIKRLFTQKVAGGNVIKLKNKWYLSFSEAFKLFSAFLYLTKRFLNVTTRMSIFSIAKKLNFSFADEQ